MVLIVYYGLLTVSVIGGQMNSDPAPGRSPGPPGMNTLYDQHGNEEDSPTLVLTKDPDENFSSSSSQNRNDKKMTVIPLDQQQREHSDTGQMSSRQDDGKDTELLKLGASEKARRNEAMNPSCSNQLSDYLRPNDKIMAAVLVPAVDYNDTREHQGHDGKDDAYAGTGERTFSAADIQLDITHDLFNTHNGIACGLMYKGKSLNL
ncbi:unnamed protein product [Hermetia illucens]|uniref:Uncharacterized protein n=1 Tax=Hermetia illucens TaxID=343691 RepID=A0A7R8YZA7_HERIL|nr:unnamed protein product [Hermetia illucens]